MIYNCIYYSFDKKIYNRIVLLLVNYNWFLQQKNVFILVFLLNIWILDIFLAQNLMNFVFG